jgi:hypothetical protein
MSELECAYLDLFHSPPHLPYRPSLTQFTKQWWPVPRFVNTQGDGYRSATSIRIVEAMECPTRRAPPNHHIGKLSDDGRVVLRFDRDSCTYQVQTGQFAGEAEKRPHKLLDRKVELLHVRVRVRWDAFDFPVPAYAAGGHTVARNGQCLAPF